MKKQELGWRVQQEMRGMLRLSPLVVVSLLLVVLLWGTDSAANSGLFQSSPVETPAPTSSPTSTSAVPSETPGMTVTAAITETVAPVETPTELPPTETSTPTATTAPTEPPSTDTPTASPTIETAEPEATEDENERYPDEESNLRFEWGMLFDSAALFFSYVWLCCGILVFLAVPVLFVVLWRASAVRRDERQQEESPQEED